MMIASKLTEVIHQHGNITDIHVTPGKPILVRSPGGYVAFDDEIVTNLDIDQFAANPTVVGQGWKYRVFSRGGKLSGAVNLTNSRVRFTLFESDKDKREISILLRVIRGEPLPIEALNYPSVFREFAAQEAGLVLITGPTGSGKTTTLSALIDHINRHRNCRIYTVEEPVEYVHKSKSAFVVQREIGPSTRSFADGVQLTLREDPDVIAVGDIPDRESAAALLNAARSGRAVFAVVPGECCNGALEHLLGFFEGAEREERRQSLAFCLTGVICQSLAPSPDKKSWVLSSEVLANKRDVQQIIPGATLSTFQATCPQFPA